MPELGLAEDGGLLEGVKVSDRGQIVNPTLVEAPQLILHAVQGCLGLPHPIPGELPLQLLYLVIDGSSSSVDDAELGSVHGIVALGEALLPGLIPTIILLDPSLVPSVLTRLNLLQCLKISTWLGWMMAR